MGFADKLSTRCAFNGAIFTHEFPTIDAIANGAKELAERTLHIRPFRDDAREKHTAQTARKSSLDDPIGKELSK
jgi:hypothetical protein